MEDSPNNFFNMSYYNDIIEHALACGYKFVTLREFVRLDCPNSKHFIIRHDVDRLPTSLNPITDVERRLGIQSTIFIRIAGADYNPFGYAAMAAFKRAARAGAEIGLHTAFVEYARICELVPNTILAGELAALRTFFPVVGVATHRDINYMHNSLPHLEREWSVLRKDLCLEYQAYDKTIMDATTYVNEGFNPHLCWRSLTPHDAIDTGRSVYLLTHPHWWFKDHPFEAT